MDSTIDDVGLTSVGKYTFKVMQLRRSVQNILAQDALVVNRFSDTTGLTERTSVDPRYRRFSFLWEFKL